MSEESHKSQRDSLQDHLAAACKQYQLEFDSGEHPKTETYLATFAQVHHGIALSQLLRLELKLLQQMDAEPSKEEYSKRFADLAAVVDEVFSAASQEDASTKEKTGTGTAAFSGSSLLPGAKLPAGTVVGEYIIESVIAEGTFGIVYRARDQQLDRAVALKVAKPFDQDEVDQAKLFLEEAQTAAKIVHSGIVTVFGCGEVEPGVPFVAMQLVKGDSLDMAMKDGPIDWRDACQLAIGITEALAHAHHADIVHRDLKPANILLDTDGRPLVADFGLAIHYEHQPNREHEVAGTAAYMSPEQIRGESQWLDGRIDIWALGVILYEVVTGRHPFRSNNKIKLAEEILSREPWPMRQINPHIPAEFEKVVKNCLRKEVVERYSTAADLAEALKEALDVSKLRTSEPVSLLEPPSNTLRRAS